MATKKKPAKRKGFKVLLVKKSGDTKTVLTCPTQKAADAAARKLGKTYPDVAYMVART